MYLSQCLPTPDPWFGRRPVTQGLVRLSGVPCPEGRKYRKWSKNTVREFRMHFEKTRNTLYTSVYQSLCLSIKQSSFPIPLRSQWTHGDTNQSAGNGRPISDSRSGWWVPGDLRQKSVLRDGFTKIEAKGVLHTWENEDAESRVLGRGRTTGGKQRNGRKMGTSFHVQFRWSVYDYFVGNTY